MNSVINCQLPGPWVQIPIQVIAELAVSETANDACHRIFLLISQSLRPLDLSLSIRIVDSTSGCQNEEYQSRQVVHLQGSVTIPGSGPSACRSFIQSFVSLKKKSVYLSVNALTPAEDVVFDKVDIHHLKQQTNIADFRLGSRVGFTDFVSHFAASNVNERLFKMQNLTLTFVHDQKRLHINFFVQKEQSLVCDVGTNYELRVKYDHVSGVVVDPVEDESEVLRVFFILKYAPLLYEKVTKLDLMTMPFIRLCTFPVDSAHGGIEKQDFARCNVLVVEFPVTGARNVLRKFATHEVAIVDPWLLVSNFKRFTDFSTPIPVHFASMKMHESQEAKVPFGLMSEAHFPVMYAFECCLRLSHQLADNLMLFNEWDMFLVEVMSRCNQNLLIAEKAMFDLYYILDRNKPADVRATYIELYSELVRSNFTDYTSVEGVRKIRRAIITPTHVVLLPPYPFVESRLMRLSDPDFALRCHVRDDDETILTLTIGQGSRAESKEQFMRTHIQDVVLNGVTVGQRVYELLGSSCSQMRDHGLTLYAKDNEGRDARYFIGNPTLGESGVLGDFTEFRCVGKYIARVGQASSQMLDAVVVDVELAFDAPDIIGGKHPQSKNPYVFTDGVGLVNRAMAQIFADKLKLPEVPSAFQIRYKGCKGMVVVDNTSRYKEVLYPILVYRESMNKFKSKCSTLELLKYSTPRPVYLNRPLVNLLDQLGTNPLVFDRLLADHISQLIDAFLDEDAAVKCIKSYRPEIYKLMNLDLVHASGLSILSEPFFRRVLDVIIKNRVRELKENARIQLPFDEGRVMFGVADETQILAYGQVFVRYTHSEKGPNVHIGEVMVTKNPCMHPGDVRKFEAVDVPALHHIVDCIVFPVKGTRPHPNEMAGSDLDGDEYSVFWMEDLFFKGENREPMIYSDGEPKTIDHPITNEDVMASFCAYIHSNQVGQIASAHLALSDRLPEGIDDPRCISLCHKNALSLDFAKTGVNAVLSPEEKPTAYPDFMGKGAEKTTYFSSRVMGTIFRWVEIFEQGICVAGPDVSLSYELNPIIEIQGWKNYQAVALDDFSKYKMTIECLMKDLAIESEEYLLSCVCHRRGRFLNSKNEDTQELLERIVKATIRGFRERFESGTSTDLERQQKAVAYYMTARVDQMTTPGKKWYGFPWIAAKELSSLVKNKASQKNGHEHLMVTQVDTAIQQMTQMYNVDSFAKADFFLQFWLTNQSQTSDYKQPLMGLQMQRIREILASLHASNPDQYCYTYNVLHVVQPRPGFLVVQVLRQLIRDMISGLEKHNGSFRVIDLGRDAMICLNKCFRSGKIDCLTIANSNPAIDLHRLKLQHFHITILRNSEDKCYGVLATKTLSKMLRHDEDKQTVLQYFKRISGVTDLSSRIDSHYHYDYCMMTAIGDDSSLARLNEQIIRKDFYVYHATMINLEKGWYSSAYGNQIVMTGNPGA